MKRGEVRGITQCVVAAGIACLLGQSCGAPAGTVAADVKSFDDAADSRSVGDAGADSQEEAEAIGLDLGALDVGDALEIDSGCAPGAGCFLDPCENGSNCASGLCVDHLGNSVCSITCVEECPQGWTCKLIDGLGPDPLHACISDLTTLCLPCHTSADCETVGGKASCLDYGQAGLFCGADCPASGCPAGFSCKPAHSLEGSTIMQCVSDSGDCACSDNAVALGLTTPCSVSNGFGTCQGIRACGGDGLGPCNAAVPAAEICNGIDDDCDGTADQGTCDDDNQCTQDSCDAAAGCQHAEIAGGCDDQDVCSLADHCEDGDCIGDPIVCDDQNPCTFDNCDAVGGCVYSFNAQPCDDDDPCTLADKCEKGTCKGVPVDCECEKLTDCVAFDDGNLCNGTLVCDTAQVPHKCVVAPGTVIECPAPTSLGAECLKPVCNPGDGKCGTEEANEGAACSDGNACTTGEWCASGVCGNGGSANCNDGNGCTTDWCDPAVGCVHSDNTDPCTDYNGCTVGDTCAAGECAAGDLLACDDGNPCTSDSCDPAVGCVHASVAGPCDDGNSCTTDDACVNGVCKGIGSLQCDDANPCTLDLCLADGGCEHSPMDVGCSDGDPCTVNDQCVGGMCASGTPVSCEDGSPCTADSCQGGVCMHEPVEGQCSDGNACSVGDHCEGGACVPLESEDCDDNNVCTTDWCDPVSGCVHGANKMPCDDGNKCTQGDACLAAVCKSGAPVACADGNPCTEDSCSPTQGCQFTPNSEPCDDGNLCTTVDTCKGGFCKGSVAPDCNDGNACTSDSCDPEVGCIHDVGPMNGAPCAAGVGPCAEAGSCSQGACVSLGKLPCDDSNLCTDDSCDPVTGACANVPNSLPCDDLNPCTSSDTCTLGACLGLEIETCDDGNPCTNDKCSPLSGCIHTVNSAPCDDLDTCTIGDSCKDGVCAGGAPLNCNDGNVCTDDSCDPAGGCVHAPAQGPCDDGDICTPEDECEAGACAPGGALDCDDGNGCTTDGCAPLTGCTHEPIVPCCGNGAVEQGEDCDDGNLVSGDGCSKTCTVEPETSCKTLHAKSPNLPTGNYTIDPDGSDGPIAPLLVRCDMTTDGGGYTMVRFDDGSLGGDQNSYRGFCATYGMEVVTPRTKAHAMSILSWNGGEPPNIVNVFPKYNGAYGLSNWTGRCLGQDCSFWMSDSDSCGCSNFEPNGDNDTANAIYRRTTGCDFGNWNDAGNRMDIYGSVICSTNDK